MKKLYIYFTMLMTALFCACSNSDDMNEQDRGYLTITTTTVTNTNNLGTRAIPAEYNAKQLAVEILNAAGEVVKSTDDASTWTGLISLKAGKYTVNAHSNNWDGKDSGRDVPFYAGSATVEIEANTKSDVNIVCTQANVKVSVNFDASVAANFKSAYVDVVSAVQGVGEQTFTMGQSETLKSAYFPVGKLTATLHVTNSNDQTFSMEREFTDVQARDHFVLNYSVENHGNGEFTVTATDSETTHTYNFLLVTDPKRAFNTEVESNAWATFAYLSGSIANTDIEDIDDSKVKFELKANKDTEWTVIDAVKNGTKYTAKASGLTPSTIYSYRLSYIDGINTYSGVSSNFTTDDAPQLPNSGFESWTTSNKLPYATDDMNNLFWGSSNTSVAGITAVGASGDSKVYRSGAKSLKLVSAWKSIKFAAGSLFIGDMPDLQGTDGAKITFGRPFTSRPSQLTGYFTYSTGKVNRAPTLKMPDGSDVPLKVNVDDDLWSCYIALTTERYTFDNSSQEKLNSTIKDFKSGNDPTVIAYGEVADADCVSASDWTKFTVNLTYYDTTTKPEYIIIVMASSKYGDYFTGYDNSQLHIDDLELVYGEPQTK